MVIPPRPTWFGKFPFCMIIATLLPLAVSGCSGCQQTVAPQPLTAEQPQVSAEAATEAVPPRADSSAATADDPASSEQTDTSSTPTSQPSSPPLRSSTTADSPSSRSAGGETAASVRSPTDAARIGQGLFAKAQLAAQKGDEVQAFTAAADALGIARRYPADAACREVAGHCEELLAKLTPQLKPTGAPGASVDRVLIEK